MEISKRITKIALDNGATIAGIADMQAVKNSASHKIYTKMGDYTGVGTVKDNVSLNKKLFCWPDTIKSVLVIGLFHPQNKPELDWWDGKGTPGNRILIDIIKKTSQQIKKDLKHRLSQDSLLC